MPLSGGSTSWMQVTNKNSYIFKDLILPVSVSAVNGCESSVSIPAYPQHPLLSHPHSVCPLSLHPRIFPVVVLFSSCTAAPYLASFAECIHYSSSTNVQTVSPELPLWCAPNLPSCCYPQSTSHTQHCSFSSVYILKGFNTILSLWSILLLKIWQNCTFFLLIVQRYPFVKTTD